MTRSHPHIPKANPNRPQRAPQSASKLNPRLHKIINICWKNECPGIVQIGLYFFCKYLQVTKPRGFEASKCLGGNREASNFPAASLQSPYKPPAATSRVFTPYLGLKQNRTKVCISAMDICAPTIWHRFSLIFIAVVSTV